MQSIGTAGLWAAFAASVGAALVVDFLVLKSTGAMILRSSYDDGPIGCVTGTLRSSTAQDTWSASTVVVAFNAQLLRSLDLRPGA